MTWPGPRVMLAYLEGQPMPDWIGLVPVHYLVIELTTSHARRFGALRMVITRLIRARIELDGLLLYASNGLPQNGVERLADAARENPWLVEFATDPVDGLYSMLVLGEKIVTNPLFRNFLITMQEVGTEIQTVDCIALTEEHLASHEEDQG